MRIEDYGGAAGAERPCPCKWDFQQRDRARRDDRSRSRDGSDAAIRMAVGIPCYRRCGIPLDPALAGIHVVASGRSSLDAEFRSRVCRESSHPSFGKRDFWLLASSAVVVNSVSYFLADWIPLYLKTERGFSFAFGNMLSMLVYGGLDAGNLLAGAFVRARRHREWTWELRAISRSGT